MLASLELGLSLGGVIGVVTVQVAVILIILAGLNCLLDLIALFLLFLGKLEVKPLLFGLFFKLGGEGPPRELDGHGALVDNFKVLMREQSDARRFSVDVALGEVNVVVMRLTEDWDLGFEPVVLQCELFAILTGLLWHEVEHDLGDLAHLEDALALADLEVGGHRDLPLCGLLADVADDDGLLGLVLDGHQAEVQLVGEVKHGTAATGSNGHYELLALSHNHQIIAVV